MKNTWLISIFFLLLISVACQVKIERFSEEKPYAIIIEKYRSPEDAWESLQRARDMGIPIYMAHVNEEETGAWYMLLTGAFKTLEEAIAQRIGYEDDYSFLYLDIVNYNQVSRHQLVYVDEYKPISLPDSIASPAYTEHLVNLLMHAPYNKSYRLEDVKVVQTNDSIDVLRRTSLRTNVFDMPRGVYPPSVINEADVLTEIIYYDELIGQRYTVDVVALKPSHGFGADVSEAFAEKIIGTRDYEFEEMLPREFQGKLNLKGFAVNIEPQKGRVYRYLVLHDITGKYLYLIQSTKSSQENIDSFAKSIGEANGLLSYPALFEKLSILKEAPNEQGHLAYIHYRILNEVPGKTGAFIEKHTKTNFVFFSPVKGEWEFTASRYFDPTTINTIFTNVYTPYRRNKKDSIEVQQNHAWLTTLRRRHPDTRKYVDFPNEIQFANDKFIFVISNKRYALLEQDEMMDFLNRLDLSPRFKTKKGFLEDLLAN